MAYNRTFSPPAASYSVRLRPDIALYLPDGPNADLHLFDAKFSVRRLSDAGLDTGEGGERRAEAEERKGVFTRGDLYKMHTYRDAIRNTHSVWILYPGTEFRFFDSSNPGSVVRSPEDLPDSICGVGAIPFAPKPDGGSGPSPHREAVATLRKLLGRHLPGAGADRRRNLVAGFTRFSAAD